MKINDFFPEADSVEFAQGFYAVYNADTHQFLAKVGLYDEGDFGELDDVLFSDLIADAERFREPAEAEDVIKDFENDDPNDMYQELIVINVESFYSFKPYGTKKPNKTKPLAADSDNYGDEAA